MTVGIFLPTATVLAEPPNSSESTGLAVRAAGSHESIPNSEKEVIPLGENASTGVLSEADAKKATVTSESPSVAKSSLATSETTANSDKPIPVAETPAAGEALPTSSPEATFESEPTPAIAGAETSQRKLSKPEVVLPEVIEKEPAESETPTGTEPAADPPKKSGPTPEELARYEKFAEADRLYLSGDTAAAARLYREVKGPFASETQFEADMIPEPIYDAGQLPPAAAVYWRIYQEGIGQPFKSKRLVPLKLLVEQYPEFIPAHLSYVQVLKEDKQDEEALKVLQQAATLYPNEPPLVQAKIEADAAAENWLEASITARQFALLNPDRIQAKEFAQLADQYLENYKDDLRSKLIWQGIGNVITGGLGYVLTGNLFAPLSALETTILLLQGESSVGDRFSKDLQQDLPLLKDPEVLDYVRGIGNKLAAVTGRNEFEYEFYVVMDDRLNAFALPGGKVFVNTGAILKTDSEAELAGLLAHELSHAVLSHAFQLMAQGSLTANITQFIPYVGGMAADLLVFNYSRDMEQQADLFGTRLLVANGYAADGVRNLMVTLEKEDEPNPPAWLSTHPDTEDRVRYLETAIVRNHYNRYAYEGVSKHREIQERVKQLWEEYKKTEERVRK